MLRFFLRHSVAANLLMIIMLASGYWALTRLNIQFFPKFNLNTVSVQVIWPGANANDVVTSISDPLLTELKDIDSADELEKITAYSQLGRAQLILEFAQGVDIDAALEDVKQKIEVVRDLPSDSQPPVVQKTQYYEEIGKILLYGPDNLDELRPLAKTLEQKLLAKKIDKVEIAGLPDHEIAIEISAKDLFKSNLSLIDVANKIRSSSQDRPAGSSNGRVSAKQIRTLEQRRKSKEFADLYITNRALDNPIRLGDIATITYRPKEFAPLLYRQDKPAVTISVFRAKNSNTLATAEALNEAISEISPTLDDNISLELMNQRWIAVKERVNLLLKNGLGGLFLIILFLMTFLRRHVAFWVCAGIPISFSAALFILYLLGGSINMISLFGFIMALGIIVDDAIVVGEEALVQFQQGASAEDAALTAARKLAPAVLSSSATTIAAFAPLIFISDIIGDVLREIPIVVICVIIASLIECFFVLPFHLKTSLERNKDAKPWRITQFGEHITRRIRRRFKRILLWSLKNPASILCSLFAAFVLCISLFATNHVQFTFFPSPDQQNIFANVKFTAGTPTGALNDFLTHLESSLVQTNNELSKNEGMPIVLSSYRQRHRQVVAEEGGSATSGREAGSIYVELSSPEERHTSNQAFINRWQKNTDLPAGIEQFSITQPQAGPPGKAIDIQLSVDTLAQLNQAKQAALEIQDTLKDYNGVSNIRDDLPYGQEQLVFSLNENAHRLGYTTQIIAEQIQAALSGRLAQIYYDNNDEIEVRTILPEVERFDPSILQHLPIFASGNPGSSIKNSRLDHLVNFRNQRGYDVIKTTNNRFSVNITAEVDPDVANSNQIISALQQTILPEIKSRYQVDYDFAGRAEEQSRTLGDMKAGLLLAIAGIYCILAWVFSSYTLPILIIITIPFGLIGAIIGHWLLGLDVTLLSLFGLFGLSGILINDAIILIKTYQSQQTSHTSLANQLMATATRRLRPVLLTSFTTIFGLLPLLFETSLQARFLVPMAVSISFGLIFSTVLILIALPVFISLLHKHQRHQRGQTSNLA